MALCKPSVPAMVITGKMGWHMGGKWFQLAAYSDGLLTCAGLIISEKSRFTTGTVHPAPTYPIVTEITDLLGYHQEFS